MLVKLIKNQLFRDSKTVFCYYLIMFLLSVTSAITFGLNKAFDNDVFAMINTFFNKISTTVCLFSIVAAIFYSCYCFYKQLLKDEGYLMHTLPVSEHFHIISRLICLFIWELSNLVACFLLISLANCNFTWLTDAIKNDFGSLKGHSLFIASIILYVVLILIYNVLSIYASLAIGFSFPNSKGGYAIITYIIIYVVNQVASTITLVAGMLISNGSLDFSLFNEAGNDIEKMLDSMGSMFGIGSLLVLVMIVILYVLTNKHLSNKLNLE